MQQSETRSKIVRFGTFEVDLHEGRLTKSGLRVRLQGQPFQILTLLLERAGEIVTREEIRQKLWSEETFVEFDDALNTAVRKLRTALGDTAGNPRFLETVPRRGYRFVAPVTVPIPTKAKETAAILPVMEAPPLLELEQFATNPAPPTRQAPRYLHWLAAMIVVALVSGGVSYRILRKPPFQIGTQDTIVIADFINTTGEGVFDDALRQGLEIGLEQSPSVKILPDRKASVILKQMGRSPEEKITGRTAIEVCQRAGGKAAIEGSIASLGTAYLIGLAAIRCDNGEPVANEQVQARRKEDVVDALGRATAQMRSRLGESLPSIQRYNAPLELATTASLDALNAYSLALSTWDNRGNRESLPIFKKAVELDPNFAQAYGALATIYHNLGESDLARAAATRAYELRSRVTQAEKTIIEARYYSYVTGDLEKTAEVYAQQTKDYPNSAGPYNHLANTVGELGRYEESEQNFRKAILLDPSRANTYSNLVIALLASSKYTEAAQVLQEAARRKLNTDGVLQAKYWVAFLRGDDAEMKRLVDDPSLPAGGRPLLLSEASNTEAYHGRLHHAAELSRQAAHLSMVDGDKESAAITLAQAAVREAEMGRSAEARAFVAEARKLYRGDDVLILTALTMGRLGNRREVETASQQLNKQWPAGTFVQRYWLPLLRAQTHLSAHQPSRAIEDLEIAAAPLEFATPSAMPVAPLYPAYLRGEAYLQNREPEKALTEFQKLINSKGMTINYPLGSLAYLGAARAYVLAADKKNARDAYQQFLDRWSSADPDLPALRAARTEYAGIQ